MAQRSGKILILLLVLVVAVSIAMTYWERFGPKQEPPLHIGLRHENHGRRYHFILEVKDSNGRKYSYIRLPNGEQAPPPRLIIMGPDRQRIANIPMQYRFGGNCVATHRMPFKQPGRYYAIPRVKAPGVAYTLERHHFDMSE